MILTVSAEVALHCIQVLRKVCATEDETTAFNEMLTHLKLLKQMTMIPEQTWQLLQRQSIFPISLNEAPDGVDPAEAKKFYAQ